MPAWMHNDMLPAALIRATQVQIADVLIGGAIEAGNVLAGLRQRDFDPEKLLQFYRDDQFIHLIPSPDFEEQKKFRAGSQSAEMIDYFSQHLP